MSEGILGLVFLLLVGAGWALFCNRRTLKQRRVLIRLCRFGHPDYDELNREWWAIDYGAHHWALMTFSDPIKLYGETTQKAWAETHATPREKLKGEKG